MVRDVAFVVYDGMTALDLLGVYDPLTRLVMDGFADYEYEVVSFREPVSDGAGLEIGPDRVGPSLDHDMIVVPGGRATRDLVDDEPFIDWLATAKDADRLVSVCTGSLLLGAIGVLEGRTATTHPTAYDALADYCETVSEERIVSDGRVVTARGVTSSIDVGLWLCRDLAGDEAAAAVRERMDYPYGDY